ncbi:MAG TPA: hypothetical protein P5142_17800 [Spirochaetia bacterium]|nr:hypothetical protein [Spirochaetia bacterium]
MPQMIHFQDDIFFLSVLIKALDAGLSTEADPEHFRERVAGDLFFLDGSLKAFRGLLAQNALLIDRSEYLKLLERSSRSFVQLLERLVGGEYPRSEAYASYRPQLEAILRDQVSILAELDGILDASLSGATETDLVSQDELSELLKE